jgi:translation initiation factor IF-2
MSEQKPTRLAKAAAYFNVGRDSIAEFLQEKGFTIDDNPNAKIDESMFAALNEKFSSEHDLKEQTLQYIPAHNKPKEERLLTAEVVEVIPEPVIESTTIVELEETEVATTEITESTPVIENVDDSSPQKIKAKVPELGLKTLGKIDLTPKITKKVLPVVEPVQEPIIEPEKVVEFKEEVKSEPVQEKKSQKPIVEPTVELPTEHISTQFQQVAGLKQMGKLDPSLMVSDRTKKADKKKEDLKKGPLTIDDKKKRSRINETVNADKTKVVFGADAEKTKVVFDKKTNKQKREKFEVQKSEEQKKLDAKKNIQVPRNMRQKLRKKKRDDHAEKAQIEADSFNDGLLQLTEFITVNELASLMNKQPTQIITFCFGLGVVVSINQRLDAEVIELVASEFGFEVEFLSVEDSTTFEEIIDDPADLETRAPIVTIMGHVDHGKTSLLDYIRNANVVKKEAGGITQHIGAYDVMVPKHNRKITFIDTPGHEAFTAMRARGAKLTDIAIIVIAADDKVMPQTREAISHAQSAGVPMIFAINKMDKDGANPEGVRTQLSEMNVLVESWGGKFQDQEISAKKGLGVDELLEKILLEADMMDLKANPNRLSSGTVIEAALDKGRGYVATVLVTAGTLNVGDFLVAGSNYGKIKAMYDHTGSKVIKVYPGEPVQVLGLNGAPSAGENFKEFDNEQDAKQVAYKRSQIEREQGIRTKKHITLDEIGRRLALGTFKELNVIIKGDMDGSVQALSDSLTKLSTQEIQVNILHKAIGAITESDVLLASASDAIVIGFQVRPTAQAKVIAEREAIDIRHYSVIYQAIDEIKAAMEGMLEPTVEEKITGNLEIREVFKITKVGSIAGCFVTDGKVYRTSKIRIIREGIVVHTGKLASLKRFKDDVKEVVHGQDCGLNIDNYNDIMSGDVIEAYEEVEIKRTLS